MIDNHTTVTTIKRQLLAEFTANKLLVQPEVIDTILKYPEPLKLARELITTILNSGQQLIIVTEADFNRVMMMKQKKEKEVVATAEEVKVKILRDITGKSKCEGNIRDFTKYFRARFNKLQSILRGSRVELQGAVPISRLRRTVDSVKFIAMVSEVSVTRQETRILELEDLEGSIRGIIPTGIDNPDSNNLRRIVLVKDEVIGVIGKFRSRSSSSRRGGSGGGGSSSSSSGGGVVRVDEIYIENIIQPDIPLTNKPRHRAEEPVAVAFISDIHIGNKTFIASAWAKFIRWLRGELALSIKADAWRSKLKYIVIVGDTVDGIGIYPGQYDDLLIRDIYTQYETLAKLFADIPEDIQIIVLPGNHDAVRAPEPQPALPSEFTKLFPSQFKFVGNPCYFSIEGVEILAYHGRSMDDFVLAFPGFQMADGIPMMIEMLKRRHLAPIYGGKTPIAPEHEDYLLIDRIPDIFVMGHGHGAGIGEYRGVRLINTSTWQYQTAYQKMLNINPDPCKVAIVDLQSFNTTTIKFI